MGKVTSGASSTGAVYSQQLKDAFDKKIASYAIKVYIEDEGVSGGRDPEWVDFSDRLQVSGKSKLVNLGPVRHTFEKEAFAFQTEIGSLTLDNVDRFFDNPPPTTLKTLYGSSAQFNTSAKFQCIVLNKNRVKILLEVMLVDLSIELVHIGVFIIQSIVTDSSSGVANVKLVGLATPLMKRDASVVKNGMSWYVNVSASFLVEELLKLEYADKNGKLPKTFTIEKNLSVPVADGSLSLSPIGRPPEFDGSSWRNDGLKCRYIVQGNFSGTDSLGDSLANRFYLGCDDTIWDYNPTTDKYTAVASSSNLGVGYFVRRLWWHSGTSTIIGVAWQDITLTNRTVGMKIFKFVWNDSTKVYDFTMFTPTGSGTDATTIVPSVYPGDFFHREGRTSTNPGPARSRSIGRLGDVNANGGKNFLCIFNQTIQSVNTAWPVRSLYPRGALSDNTGLGSAIGSFPVDSGVGFRAGFIINTGSDTTERGLVGMKFSLNQQGVVLFSNVSSGKVYYFTMVASGSPISTLTADMKEYNVATNAVTSRGMPTDNPAAGEVQLQPCSGDSFLETSNRLLICFTKFDDTADNTAAVLVIANFDVDTPAWTTYNNVATTDEEIPIEIRYVDVGALGKKVFYSTVALATTTPGEYRLRHRNLATGGDSTSVYFNNSTLISAYSNKQYYARSFVNTGTNPNGILYFYECGTGRVGKYDGTTLTYVDNGFYAVIDDYYIMSNMVADTTKSYALLYGVSAPVDKDEALSNKPSGRYYLFKLDNVLPDRIELADFSGMTVWDALNAIAQLSNTIIGFDTIGNFALVKRVEIVGTADYTIENEETTGIHRTMNINKGFGEDDVFTYVEISPSVTKLQPVKWELNLLDRTALGALKQAPFIEMFVDQRDLLKKNVLAHCITRGKVDDGVSRWRFLTYDTTVEVAFAIKVLTTDTVLTLRSVYGGANNPDGVHIDDFIIVTNPSTNLDIVRGITAVDSVANTITINSNFGVAFNVNDIAQIIKQNKVDSSFTNKQWSDEGITYTAEASGTDDTVGVRSVRNLGVGMVVKFGAGGQERRIKSINPAATPDPTITVDSVFTSSVAANTIIYGWWSPNKNDTYFEIGGSKIFVKFTIPTGSGLVEGTDYDKTFWVGDKISVLAPGLTLEKDDRNKQIAYSSTAAKTSARTGYPSFENRFMSRKVANQLVKEILNRYKDPHYTPKVQTSLLPYIEFIGVSKQLVKVDVKDKDLFPLAKSNTVQCYIRSIEHDLVNKRSVFELRAVEAY